MLSVLIIDDEAVARRIVHLMLEKLGYQVFEAESGQDGEKLALELKPDFVLLDIMMPSQDGYTTCAHLRARGYFGTILMLSAVPEEDGKEKALEGSANGYLCKPLNLTMLGNYLKNLQQTSPNFPKM